jgi:hypothetical protein
MHEPAACGALPAQQAKWHIGPLASEAVGMLAHRIDSRMVAPRMTLGTRITVEPKLCLFILGTDQCRNYEILSRLKVSHKGKLATGDPCRYHVKRDQRSGARGLIHNLDAFQFLTLPGHELMKHASSCCHSRAALKGLRQTVKCTSVLSCSGKII